MTIFDVRNLATTFDRCTAVDTSSCHLIEGTISGLSRPDGADTRTLFSCMPDLMPLAAGARRLSDNSLQLFRQKILGCMNFSSRYVILSSQPKDWALPVLISRVRAVLRQVGGTILPLGFAFPGALVILMPVALVGEWFWKSVSEKSLLLQGGSA